MKRIMIMTIFFWSFLYLPSQGQETGTGDPLEGFETLVAEQGGPREPTGSGGSTSGGGMGGGEIQHQITANWFPFTKLLPEDVLVSWTSNPTAMSYEISIREDNALSKAIFSIHTSAKKLTLPLEAMDLKEDQDYYLEITAQDGSVQSPKYNFSMLSFKTLQQTLDGLNNDPRFVSADEDHKILMQAFVFEKLELYKKASELYHTYRVSDASDILFRNMRDRFLERMRSVH